MQAKDVMTSKVISVSDDTPVHDIVRLLVKHRISAVPVVNANQQVVGIVSEGDLLSDTDGVAPKSAWWLAAVMLGGAPDFDKLHSSTAGEVMTLRVITVQENASLAEIARILERNHIKRVPVVRDDRLVGIVSRANLLHGLANDIIEQHEPGAAEDRAIRARVVDALGHQTSLDSHIINVTVNGGVVALWGVVDGEHERATAERIAEGVSGVQSIQNNLGPGQISGLPM
jgi:CBS domain-containing protein